MTNNVNCIILYYTIEFTCLVASLILYSKHELDRHAISAWPVNLIMKRLVILIGYQIDNAIFGNKDIFEFMVILFYLSIGARQLFICLERLHVPFPRKIKELFDLLK